MLPDKVQNALVSEEAIKAFRELEKAKIEQEILEAKAEQYKLAIKEAMKANGIKKAVIPLDENKNVTLTYVSESKKTNRKVDYNALKEQGLYDMFVTETVSPVADQLRLKFDD